ncbi:MAG: hypothetical protein R3F20_18830 [Planctomycetota bacterium]
MVSISGFFLAFVAWVKDPELPARVARRQGPLHRFLAHEMRVDRLARGLLAAPLRVFTERIVFEFADRRFARGTVERVVAGLRGLGSRVAATHSGALRVYLAVALGGLLLVLLTLAS